MPHERRYDLFWPATATRANIRACDGKVRFPSKKNAAARARKLREVFNDPTRLNAYKCPCCHNWHIGNSRVWTKVPPTL